MLTRSQIILLQQARRASGLPEDEYRMVIASVAGMSDCRSSKDPRLGDDHFDRLMKLFEFHFWALVDAGQAPSPALASRHVFRNRAYWAAKNPREGVNSRDRFSDHHLGTQIANLENRLHVLGKHPEYIAAIEHNTGGGFPYLCALKRTINSLTRKLTPDP